MRQLLISVALLLVLSAASQAATLRIVNQTDWQIDNVYISPSSSDHFVMYDYLGRTGVIPAGGSRSVDWVARDICRWDFRVRFHARRNYATTYKNDLCKLHSPLWTITPSDIY